METLWFVLVAVLLVGYVLLDGFDLGAGIVHLLAAKTEDERKQVLASIGPVWDGNEVWLLAGGGTLYFAFPALYASAFAGFYLPLMMVLWLLIARGIAIEFRHHLKGPVWAPLLDAAFAGSSGLLAVFFGAALGNVVRGVPLDRSGEFFLPLWTDFTPSATPGILDWYTILCGGHVFVALAVHGAAWVAHKTDGELGERAREFGLRMWTPLLLMTAVTTAATFTVQPAAWAAVSSRAWMWPMAALALAGAVGIRHFLRQARDGRAFLASCAYLAGMLASAAFSVYPNVLPSSGDPALALTITNTAAGEYGLRVGLMWWLPAMGITLGYVYFLYSRFAGKVPVEAGE